MSEVTGEDLNDIKAIMHSLRHHCESICSLKQAIPILVQKTELTQERVEFILIRFFKYKLH